MTADIDIHKPDAELTRTGLELKQLSHAWKHKPNGSRYTVSLLTFLGSKSAGTKRLYAFAILEFFSWYETHRSGYVPLPSEVLRADAFLFSQYLQTRTIGLEEHRLKQDPDRKLDLEIYQFIKKSPGSRISSIRQHLLNDHRFTVEVTFTIRGLQQRLRVLEIEASEPRGDDLDTYTSAYGRPPQNALDLRLACLCEHNLLRRKPTVEQIRKQLVNINEQDPAQAQILYRVDPEIFSYYLLTHTDTTGVERAKTTTSRLSALASFWTFLINQSAENLPGTTERLLQHNIWTEPRKEMSLKAIHRGRAMRELRTPDRDLFISILATTFTTSHGDQALAAAAAALEGADVQSFATGKPTVMDARDRAILLTVYWTGLRSEEMSTIRRSDIDMHTGLITIVGKGEEMRSFVVPQPALLALQQLQKALNDWSVRSRPAALVHSLLLPSSPLLPPLKLWGHAAQESIEPHNLTGIENSCFSKMLRSRAEMAGIEPKSRDWYKMHPHGLRHLAALEANARGVDVATIQATLGHASLATTGIYLEVRDPLDRSLMPKGRAPQRPPPVIIEQPREQPTKEVVLEKPASAKPEIEYEPDIYPAEYLAPTEEAIQLAEESEAVSFLLDEYKNHWGEKERRTKIVADVPGAKEARKKAAAEAKEKGLKAPKVDRVGMLAHAYAGKRSGLPWWAGMLGGMSDPSFSYTPNASFPTMPVISPAQFLGAAGSDVCSQPLCRALSALYESWIDDPERGPSAASAMSKWIFVASKITLEVDEVIRQRDGGWVGFEDPLAETTASKDHPPSTLREHLDDAIVAWFEAAGWQYRPAAESHLPVGDDLVVPDWYGEADPLASLPGKERLELLDWLQVIVGLPPRDPTPRYSGKSRLQLGKVLSAMCFYEYTAGDKALKDEPALRKENLAIANKEVQKQVALLTDGRVKDFDYKTRKKERRVAQVKATIAGERAEREQAGEEESESEYRRLLAPYFMGLLAELVGPEVATDPVLNLFARCTSGVPLDAGGKGQLDKYKGMFRVVGSTIAHKPDFAIEFARATGQHSECVARRLARHIYEEKLLPQWYKRDNWSDTTLPYLEAMTAYRIPCPRVQEGELRDALGTREPVPVFEEWKKAERSIVTAALPEHAPTELEEVRQQEEERGTEEPIRGFRRWEAMGSPEAKQNPRRFPLHNRTRAARNYMPNAMDFLPLFFGMRGASR